MPRVDQYLKIAAAADYLGVAPNTLRKWADEGKILVRINPANGYRLFAQSDLDAFLDSLSKPKPTKKPR